MARIEPENYYDLRNTKVIVRLETSEEKQAARQLGLLSKIDKPLDSRTASRIVAQIVEKAPTKRA